MSASGKMAERVQYASNVAFRIRGPARKGGKKTCITEFKSSFVLSAELLFYGVCGNFDHLFCSARKSRREPFS